MARPRKPRGATTKGGWGHQHQRRRAALAPYVNAGKATCCRCHEPIHQGEEWHLDHSDDRTSYNGVAHATCNLAAAGDKTFALHGHNGHNGHRVSGSVSGSFNALKRKADSGIVRCGLCGYLILRDEAWQDGRFGPEHSVCEFAAMEDFDPLGVRLWSQDWLGRPRPERKPEV